MQSDKNQLNRLKHTKKKYEEELSQYKYDIEMYNKLKAEKDQNSNFIIPEIFALKYKIFESLSPITFDGFKEIWDKEKPVNNYDMFSTTSHEMSFAKPTELSEICETIEL